VVHEAERRVGGVLVIIAAHLSAAASGWQEFLVVDTGAGGHEQRGLLMS
jgi:hypothetical protein